jgi:hypothetical protein
VWSVPAGKYELQLWSYDGMLRRRITVQDSPWFKPWSPSATYAEAMSSISYVFEDASGLLWVFCLAAVPIKERSKLPDSLFALNLITKDEWERTRARTVELVRVIDVFDLRRGVLLATRSSPDLSISRFGGEFVSSRRETADLLVWTDVWRLTVTRP